MKSVRPDADASGFDQIDVPASGGANAIRQRDIISGKCDIASADERQFLG